MVSKAITNPSFRREIGSYGGEVAGPLVIIIGGIHGNEPAGVYAMERVLERLRTTWAPFKGKMMCLAGNVGALNLGQRYLQSDLNRMWLPSRVEQMRLRSPSSFTAEEIEQHELLRGIDSLLADAPGPVIVLDLHTTSSEGAPFAIISDTLTNRHMAGQFGVPIILGLEENIDGTILNYINQFGHTAIGFEAGQHAAAASIQNHEATIWLTLIAAGCLAAGGAPDPATLRRTLQEASRGLPPFFELRYRHGIDPSDGFTMQPGFSNFHPVRKNQALASDRKGMVSSPESGFLFMPLYQSLGEDGFFLIREVRPFWLHVSRWLRQCSVDRLLPFLPGVHRLHNDDHSLIIDTRIARWFVLEVCHLLGFRKHSACDGRLVVTRRKQTTAKRLFFQPPENIN
jgi:succinylglutamate desuccinylase